MITTKSFSFNEGENGHPVIFIDGLFTSRNHMEKLLQNSFSKKTIYFNVLKLAESVSKPNLDILSNEIITRLDEHSLTNFIFVSSCIGKLIAFDIGMKRPDLVKGQIFIGKVESNINPSLKKAELELYRYIRDSEEKECFTSLLQSVMGIENKSEALMYSHDILDNIHEKKFDDLYLNIHGNRHFTIQDFKRNTIPNILFVPENQFISTSKSNLGYNKRVEEVENVRSEHMMLKSRSFASRLKESLTEFV